jgi:hypothetical protein
LIFSEQIMLFSMQIYCSLFFKASLIGYKSYVLIKGMEKVFRFFPSVVDLDATYLLISVFTGLAIYLLI